jgi:glucokinase
VTNVIGHLILAGLIELIGEGESTGGRRPDLLRFRAERGCVAGVSIDTDSIRFLLADLNGDDLGDVEVVLSMDSPTPQGACSQIAENIRRLLHQYKMTLEQLLCVAVAVPAVVNVKDGSLVLSATLKGWNKIPLSSMLSKELKCQVIIENDTNLAAQGEYYRGAAKAEKSFVYLYIGERVGAGIFLNGSIYHGSQWLAGEIGSLRVPHVPQQRPTQHSLGKLETILGGSGILKSWRAGNMTTQRQPRVDRAVQVFDLAAEGHSLAKRILTSRAAMLSDIVLNLTLILNPSIIVMGGDVGSHPSLLHEVKALLEGSDFAVTHLEVGELGSSAVLWGAVSIALDSTVLVPIQHVGA